MMTPDSDHEVPMDEFDVHDTSNQALQLVSLDKHSSGSANVNFVGVSRVDELNSSGYASVDGTSSVRIFPEINNRAGRSNSSNPISSKKKGSYYHRRSREKKEKKERLIWTVELHRCFLKYYNQFPNEKRVPKKILEEMRKQFPYITRENVASHLQKHRLYLKGLMDKKMAKSSSKSVPFKVTKEKSNLHQYNNASISTCHNPAQFPHQSQSISTNPNFHLNLQSQSIVTSPNSHLPLQSHSLSNSPNSHLPLQSPSIFTNLNPQLHLQSHSLSTNFNFQLPCQSHTLHEPLLNQLLFQFDQAHLSHQNMVQNKVPIHGGDNMYSIMMNVLESQRNPCRVIASDFPVRVNLFPPISANNQVISNIDGNDSNFHPIMDNSGLSDNDYTLCFHSNFVDSTINLNLDNVQVDAMDNNMYPSGSYSDGFQFHCPLNSNVANELQDIEEALQSIFYPPGTIIQ